MSWRNQLLIMTLLATAVLVPPAVAQGVEAGYIVAQRWCSSCHEIDKGRFGNGATPSFASIARRPSTTTVSLEMLLSNPHRRMRDSLMRHEIADVSAYILSLK